MRFIILYNFNETAVSSTYYFCCMISNKKNIFYLCNLLKQNLVFELSIIIIQISFKIV